MASICKLWHQLKNIYLVLIIYTEAEFCMLFRSKGEKKTIIKPINK